MPVREPAQRTSNGHAQLARRQLGAYTPIVPARISACTCNRLRRAARAVTQLYDDALASSNLRATQFALLRTLADAGGHTISSLAHTLLLDRTALSRNLDPLVERSLVGVTQGEDARTRHVALTAAGRRLLAQAEPQWAAVQAQVSRRLGRDRVDTLVALLDDLESLHPAHARGR